MKSNKKLVQNSDQLPAAPDSSDQLPAAPNSSDQSLGALSSIKDALQFVADKTSEAKKAAENNPFTSSGKPKSELKGAAYFTNKLKEEGIEAYNRDIVPKPNMEGGLKNSELNTAANAALGAIKILEQSSINLPNINEEKP